MCKVIELQSGGWHREARTKLSRRPWRVDTFDALAAKWFDVSSPDSLNEASAVPRSPFRRVIMFVDNAGKASTHDAFIICAEISWLFPLSPPRRFPLQCMCEHASSRK
jgi:hypothetical protein